MFLLRLDGLACVVLGKCPAVVPCATADEESGSSLKLGSSVDQPFVLLGTGKLALEILSFK